MGRAFEDVMNTDKAKRGRVFETNMYKTELGPYPLSE
jgi:hypothetical protein